MPLATRRRKLARAVIQTQATIDLANITAGSVDSSNTVTVPGAKIGDTVIVNWDNVAVSLVIGGFVSAANTVKIVASNPSAGAINAASATFTIAVLVR